MKCFEVEYGGGTALIWIPEGTEPLRAFSTMANQMFGIRKSITRSPRVVSGDKPPPQSRFPFDMALSHHGDLATFRADGTKVLSEWGDVFGVDAEKLEGAILATGRTDYEQLAKELLAKEEES